MMVRSECRPVVRRLYVSAFSVKCGGLDVDILFEVQEKGIAGAAHHLSNRMYVVDVVFLVHFTLEIKEFEVDGVAFADVLEGWRYDSGWKFAFVL